MTQDEIIEMYLQVSKELCNDTEWCWAGVGEPLQMFAKLVAAKERETCAKIVQIHFDASDDLRTKGTLVSVLDYIRARGEA
jgi:hypothetical protein